MTKHTLLATVAATALIGSLAAGPAYAGMNDPPPTGTEIYSLTGQTISGTYQEATVDFSATTSATNISFAFREDPAFLQLSNVSLVDLTTSSANLMLNGDFSLGVVGNNDPVDWQYLNTFGASFAGVVAAGCGMASGTNCYSDGAVGAYDGINQVVGTTTGDLYALSFWYADSSAGSSTGDCAESGVYQAISDNGCSGVPGNGRDMFVYAGNAPPVRTNIPEPASLALFGAGLVGLGVLRRRRKS